MLIGLMLTAVLAATPSADVVMGQVTLRVSEAESAQVFHVVDQLSGWSEFCHAQYSRWAEANLRLTPEDRALLEQHAALRRARGWGRGFEQAFYVDATIAKATAGAAEAKLLTAAEITAEKKILSHFAPKLRPLLEAGREENLRLRGRLVQQQEALAQTMSKLAKFAERSGAVVIPVFLIPNPEPGNSGGGFNGGRLVLETQATPDPMPTLLHEVFHAVLEARSADLANAATQVNGLDQQTLNEAIAYAFSPGLLGSNAEGVDELADGLAGDVLRGKTPTDAYLRFKLFAILLRPMLREALDKGEPLTVFLPRAIMKLKKFPANRGQAASVPP